MKVRTLPVISLDDLAEQALQVHLISPDERNDFYRIVRAFDKHQRFVPFSLDFSKQDNEFLINLICLIKSFGVTSNTILIDTGGR